MPATESFDPVFAAKREFDTVAAVPTYNVIETFKTNLTNVGWTLNSSIAATGSCSFPFGAPFNTNTGTGTLIANCGGGATIKIGSINFTWYNPSIQTPVDSANCIMVAMGTTALLTLDAVATAITVNTIYNASVVGPDSNGGYTMNFTAQSGGAIPNFPPVAVDGRWIAGVPVIQGGGYKLTSQGLTASKFSVTLTATGVGGNDVDGELNFHFDFNGHGTADFTLDGVTAAVPAIGPYSILATENQFAIYDPSSLTNYASRSSALFACAPQNLSSATYAAFVIGPQEFRVETTWYNTNYGKIVAIDSTVTSISDSQAYPRLLALYNCGEASPLLTPQATPVIMCPYVGYGKSKTDTPAVIGKIWDALYITDLVGDGVYTNGFLYKAVSQWDGVGGLIRGTLLLRYK